ncbi:MAG TPA: hypothetical protein VGQ34_12080, partial [Sphingomicrobium sp.]|nr:hypothetical protein [Sphingomicrobium sp.]
MGACGYQARDDGQPQRVAQDQSGNVYIFGSVEQVQGTRFFTVPILRVEGATESGSFSKTYRGDEEQNRLIVDGATGQSRRILPDSKFEIVNWIEPTSKASNLGNYSSNQAEGDVSKSSGIYAAVVKRPGKTDKDPPTYDLLLGHFEDGQQGWIARGLSGVQAVWLNQDGKLAVVAAKNDRGIYQLYDPNSFRQLLQ